MPEKVIPPAALRPRGNTILIVEDDMDIGFFLQQLIEEETPYKTVVMANGLQALENASHVHPCLLLLDYRLPGLNGIELYDRLQQEKDISRHPCNYDERDSADGGIATAGHSAITQTDGYWRRDTLNYARHGDFRGTTIAR